MALPNWSWLGNQGVARFTGWKQWWEIQVDPDQGTIDFPIYIRRSVTIISFDLLIEYTEGRPVDATPSHLWMMFGYLDGTDYWPNVNWKEGDNPTLYFCTAPKNDLAGTPLSGKWIIETKEVTAESDGKCSVSVSYRNEGPWIYDYLR